MSTYELMLVIDPLKTEDEVEAIMTRFEKLMTDAGAELSRRDLWGKRKLAYPIAGRTEGIYVVSQFKHDKVGGDLMREFERRVRLEEDLLRHICIQLPKLKKPIPIVGKPDAVKESNPDWGGARRGWRPPHRPDRGDRGDRGGGRDDRRDSGPPRDNRERSAPPAAPAAAAPDEAPVAAPAAPVAAPAVPAAAPAAAPAAPAAPTEGS